MTQPTELAGFSMVITKIRHTEASQKQLLHWFPQLNKAALDKFLTEVSPPIMTKMETESHYGKLLHKTSAIRTCGLETVEKTFPLIEGEIAHEQYYTLLTEDYSGIPKGTVVLFRSLTSMNTVTFIHFGKVMGEKFNLLQLEQEDNDRGDPAPPPFTGIASAIASKIVLSIIGAVVSKIAGRLMDNVIDEIIPPSPPKYLEEVYQEMKKIVRKELDQQVLDVTKGSLSQLMSSSLKRDYRNLRTEQRLKTAQGRRVLLDELNRYNRVIREEIRARLETDRYKIAGIQIWKETVSFHYIIYMEMAFLDSLSENSSESSTEGIHGSSYMKTLISYLEADIKRLKEIRSEIEKSRKSLLVSGSYFVFEIGYQGDVHYFKDEFDDYQVDFRQNGCKDDPAARRDKKMERYRLSFDYRIEQDLLSTVKQIGEMEKLLMILTNHKN